MKQLLKIFLFSNLVLTTFYGIGCSNSPSSATSSFPNSTSQNYFQNIQRVVVEVYYEPGAEPYTGTTLSGMNYWNIFEDNLNAIFQYRSTPPILVIPKSLSEMGLLPTQNKTEWLGTDILNLSGQHRSQEASSIQARFYVYFLKGYYSTGSGANQNIIGVSLSGTPIIAMFKQVIQSTGNNPNGPVPKYVEQSTLVHEIGHALGFVNNGVPMVNAHQDTAHGAHTTNSECVMYWQNEGASDLAAFVQKYINGGTTVMWGPEVLQDAQNYSR